MNDFNNCCFNCNLMDLNFRGPRYTWKNGNVQERLNWALANFSWFTSFKDAYVHHLNWFKSDHRHLLLKMGRGDVNRRTYSRFRFITITNDSFKDMLEKN